MDLIRDPTKEFVENCLRPASATADDTSLQGVNEEREGDNTEQEEPENTIPEEAIPNQFSESQPVAGGSSTVRLDPRADEAITDDSPVPEYPTIEVRSSSYSHYIPGAEEEKRTICSDLYGNTDCSADRVKS